MRVSPIFRRLRKIFKNKLRRFFDDSKNFGRGVKPFWMTREFWKRVKSVFRRLRKNFKISYFDFFYEPENFEDELRGFFFATRKIMRDELRDLDDSGIFWKWVTSNFMTSQKMLKMSYADFFLTTRNILRDELCHFESE